MHVGINAQLLSFSQTYRSGGISRYIHHLLFNLAQIETSHRLTALVPDLPSDSDAWSSGRFRLRQSGRFAERPMLRVAWEQTIQPLLLRSLGVDLLHATGYVAPLAWPGPTVVTICDLSFIRYPHLFNRANRHYLRAFTRWSAWRARRILTISDFTRDEVIRLLGVPPDKVVTTYCGVDDTFRPLPPDEVAAYRLKHNLPDQFILYLGTLEPRKNVGALLRAYARVRRERGIPHALVLAGAPGWQYQEIFETVSRLGIAPDVRFFGFVPANEQALCYNAASLFVYPSLYEGFGLPVLEAMACGVPVVSSNAASLPEVVESAGVQIDPGDEQALARAIGDLLNDPGLLGTMQSLGIERARCFSWRSMAQQTLDVYDEVLGDGPSIERTRA